MDTNTGLDIAFGRDAETVNLTAYLLTAKGETPFTVASIDGNADRATVTWELPGFGGMSMAWESDGEGPGLRGRYSLRVEPTASVEAVIRFDAAFAPKGEPYFQIPASLYGTNNIRDSKSRQPQLNYRGDIRYPKTPVIRTRADRSSHNAVLAVTDGRIIALNINETTSAAGDDARYYNGLGVDTRNRDGLDRISVSMGYHHFPVKYMGKLGDHSHTRGPVLGFVPFRAGKVYETHGHAYLGDADGILAYEEALRWLYYRIHTAPGNQVKRADAVKDLAEALIKAYQRDIGVFPTVHPNKAGDTAWTGGMQAAYPLLRAANEVPGARETAVHYIDNLVQNGVNPASGLYYDNKDGDTWKPSGWWKDCVVAYDGRLGVLSDFHSAYVNGQASCYILKSYGYMKAQSWEEPGMEAWLSVTAGVVNRAVSQQRYDGALPVYFDAATGEAVSHNGFQGAWWLAAIAELYAITGDAGLKAAFDLAEDHYWQYYLRGELWGMPMDTQDAVDEEGNLAYVTAVASMHKTTGEGRLMDHLVHALHYEFSWKFAYNTMHTAEPLKSLNWPSCGGSVTSSHNIHIHQMGNLIAEEMHHAYLHTGDTYILDRLKDTLNWGLGTHNRWDGYFGFGERGQATEQFFHSDGKQDDPKRIEDGGIWPDYLTWAAACVLLSGCCGLPEEYYQG